MRDLLGLGLKLHLLDAGHGGLDANSLVTLVQNLINVGVEHVSTTVDGGQTSETLGKLAKTVQRVDVRRLSVSGNRVTVQADTLNGLRSLARGGDVVISQVQSHGVANEVLGSIFKAELVINILHGAGVQIKTYQDENDQSLPNSVK
jgi:predicted aldo/keto reductase-like oxidoreductase